MIRAQDLTVRRGQKLLLKDAQFVIHPGERVGLVGANGAGKSSLFALINQEIEQDQGSLLLPASWRLASIAQEIHDQDRAARDFVMDGDTLLRSLEAQRAQADLNDGTRIAELEMALMDAGSLDAQARAEQLLTGLGFKQTELLHPVGSFSGGWQMRLNLAKALMAPSDLLLLDEPTNHLDLDAMLWLERWMTQYPGTIIVISHDTEFLNAVSNVILHLENQSLERYKGNYDSFTEQRAEKLRQANLAYERQTEKIAQLRQFIDRFKAKASKAKQAQSRVKALDRMEKLAPLRMASGIHITIPSPDYMPDPLLTLEQLTAGYSTQAPILKNVNLSVRAGARIGILGVNGAGKSTFIKTLANELPPLSGSRNEARGLEIGYFAQHQLDILDLNATPLLHLSRLAPDSKEQDLRNYLGRFGFSGDAATQVIAPMSGGEKARLALALIVWKKPNLLLLDEPSNHLDVETREALTEALAEFEGSMLLVSHDRHLLRTTVDEFWVVADAGITEFKGDLDDYRAWVNDYKQNQKSQTQSTMVQTDRKEQKRLEAQERQRLSGLRKPLEKKLNTLESKLNALTQRKAELEKRLADEDIYAEENKAERTQVLNEHTTTTQELNQVEEEWLAIQLELEELTSPH